jgi:hypothetical protein
MFAVAATCVLVVGCGGNDVASATRAGMPITRAQVIVYADAVNVRAGDLPGLGGGMPPTKREITRGPFTAAMEKCDPTVIHAGKVIGIISPHFTRSTAHKHGSSKGLSFTSTEGVSSSVYVTEGPRLASREVSALNTARARLCAKQFFMNEKVKGVGERHSEEKRLYPEAEVTALSTSAFPDRSVFGLRLAAAVSISEGSGHTTYYEDFLGFAVGPTLIILSDDGYNPRAFPSAAERHLLAVLYQRAEAHKL